MAKPKCSFAGCRCPAVWSARKLFGDRGELLTCEKHKPDPGKRPAALRSLPFFYEVKSLANA